MKAEPPVRSFALPIFLASVTELAWPFFSIFAVFAFGYRHQFIIFLISVAAVYLLFSLILAALKTIALRKRIQSDNVPEELLAQETSTWQKAQLISDHVSIWDIKI